MSVKPWVAHVLKIQLSEFSVKCTSFIMVVLVVHGMPGTSKTSLSRALVERERFRDDFLVVSKDQCKAALLLLRDDVNTRRDDGDVWRDCDSLRARLARETLAEPSSFCQHAGLDENQELESRCAERIVELATKHPSISCPDDDTLNSWSYQVMLAVTEAILGRRRHVILDAPLYRLEVVHGLGEVFSRTGTDVYIFACYVDDEKIWDGRLRKRKQAWGDEAVNKPGSVREVMAMYMEKKARREECNVVQKVMEQWSVKGTIRLDMGVLSIWDAVDAVETLVSSA